MKRDIFQAIAHPTRRAILLLIAVQALTPNNIAEHFNTTRQAVSKHLKILTECEVVLQEMNGREIYYKVNPKKIEDLDKWLDQFKQLLTKRFSQLDNVLNILKGKNNE